MTALDTDVLVRALTGDHAEQAAAAAEVMSRGRLYLAKSVWVDQNRNLPRT